MFYVGDRIKKPGQLNGKSANLNHVLLHKIYPNVRKAEEVPLKDIFMVMDCDHMVRQPPSAIASICHSCCLSPAVCITQTQ